MKIKSLLSLPLLFLGSTGFAQIKTESSVPRIKISEFSIYRSGTSTGDIQGKLADFRILAPSSKILSDDLTGFKTSNSQNYSACSYFSMQLGFQLADKDKKTYRSNPLFRVGLAYASQGEISAAFNRNTVSPYDTLTSSRTGEKTYVDSITDESYYMNYTADQIRLDISVTFRTNPEARWSVYAGAGLNFGSSINSKTRIQHRISTYTKNQNDGLGNYSFFGQNNRLQSEEEVIQSPGNSTFSAYVPLGIDFRIGNKREFWKRTHLFIEFRPSYNSTNYQGLGDYQFTRLYRGMGLKVTI